MLSLSNFDHSDANFVTFLLTVLLKKGTGVVNIEGRIPLVCYGLMLKTMDTRFGGLIPRTGIFSHWKEAKVSNHKDLIAHPELPYKPATSVVDKISMVPQLPLRQTFA